jgi:glutamate dehydrogenase/leucine dehydrogenase
VKEVVSCSRRECHNRRVHIDKLSNTGSFVVVDLDDAPTSVGIVRVAPKVLQGSATALARTATYTFAARHLTIGGASAGISTTPDQRDDAIGVFVAEVEPRVEAATLLVDPGPGVDHPALVALANDATRNAVRHEPVPGGPSLEGHLAGLGPVVAAEATLGDLEGRTAVVELGPSAPALIAALRERGVTVVAVGDQSGTAHVAGGLPDDVIEHLPDVSTLGDLQPAGALLEVEATMTFCGSRQGMVDGAVAESFGAELLVPTGCQPLSAKGLAVLRRRGVVALADFVTTSGPTFAWWPAGDATTESVIADMTSAMTELIASTSDHEHGALLGACFHAESFLATWQDSLPFGRPLA